MKSPDKEGCKSTNESDSASTPRMLDNSGASNNVILLFSSGVTP